MAALTPVQANPPFLKEVTDAQFYYLDKFILLSCGNSLHLYKYYIDTARPDDIRRYILGYFSPLTLRVSLHLNAGTRPTVAINW